ncbi:MAG: tRNA-dihydrouridine synthase [Paludibaculum sp.]
MTGAGREGVFAGFTAGLGRTGSGSGGAGSGAGGGAGSATAGVGAGAGTATLTGAGSGARFFIARYTTPPVSSTPNPNATINFWNIVSSSQLFERGPREPRFNPDTMVEMANFPAAYMVGPVEIRPATVLAPMAGVTDTVFRRLIRNKGGCGLMMTEFTSSHGIVKSASERHPNRKSTRSLLAFYFEPEEHPITAQLFGSDPEVMSEAARSL